MSREILRAVVMVFFACAWVPVGSLERPSSEADERQSQVRVEATKTEHIREPLGLQTRSPRFQWQLLSNERSQLQSAYQILVATTLEKLQAGIGDKWDSGKVKSDNSVEVSYAGSDLQSGERSYWKVRIWDNDGRPSEYSDPSSFEMGLLNKSDWLGKWIAARNSISSPIFRREVPINGSVRRARVYVSGLGYYELYVNGQKIGDRVLDPASTHYHDRQTPKLGSRVLYSTYDVTKYVHGGSNALGVMLGHGPYSAEAAESVWERYASRPCVILQMNIELSDGRTLSIASDSSWKESSGPITYNDISHGETFDARLEQPGWNNIGFNDTAWESASLAEPPSGVLIAQTLPASRVMETFPVSKVLIPKEPEFFDGVHIYDFGQNFTGWVRLTVSGPRGAKIALRYSSRIYAEDDTLDTRANEPPLEPARQTDTYILKGSGAEIWEPRFTLHGFRYVEVRGATDVLSVNKIEGRFVRSALESTGSFWSSNELLNSIHHNIQWTFMSSFQGFPQDAMERNERVGWLGDPGYVAEDYIYNFDMLGFLEKWLNDIQDSQRQNGNISVVSPVNSSAAYNSNAAYEVWPCWTNTYPLLVWYLYQYYGDQQVLAAHYDSLKRLVAFTGAAAINHIITGGLGDHMEPQENGFSHIWPLHTPSGLTSTACYYETTAVLSRIAGILGHSADARKYRKLARDTKAAFNTRFLDTNTNQYATGSQTSNALALYLELVPTERISHVLENLVDDIVYRHNTHVSTGIIGSNALVQILPRLGNAALMYKLATQTTYPSLGEQVMKGATTICETYECGPWLSQNMKMFGSLDKFFYRDLAGIAPEAPGYRRVLIKPQPVGDLQSVKASQRTVRGDVGVEWIKGDTSFDLSVSIPAGMEADIRIPTLGLMSLQIAESGSTVWKSNSFVPGTAGLHSAKAVADSISFCVGSGNYHFTVSGSGF